MADPTSIFQFSPKSIAEVDSYCSTLNGNSDEALQPLGAPWLNNEVMEGICEVREVQKRQGPNQGSQLQEALIDTMRTATDEVRNTLKDHIIPSTGPDDDVSKAAQYIQEARDAALLFSNSFNESKSNNPYDFIATYAQGFYHLINGCTYPSEENASECQYLRSNFQNIEMLTSSGFSDPIPSQNRISVAIDGGWSAIRNNREFQDFSSFYTGINPELSYQYALVNRDPKDPKFRLRWPAALNGSGPLAGIKMLVSSGNDGNLGSRRVAPLVSLGWKQSLYNAYLKASFLMGPSFNWLNFGRGFRQDLETSFNIGTSLEAGYDFYISPHTSLAPYAGCVYDQSVAGNPSFHAWNCGGGLRGTYQF